MELPAREVILERELKQVLAALVPVRSAVVGIGLLVIGFGLFFGERPERRLGFIAAAIILSLILGFDLSRIRSGRYRTDTLPFEFVLMGVIQGLVVVVTGGLESPLLPIFIPLSLLSAAAVGPKAVVPVGFLSIFLWGITAASFFDWVPRDVPRALGLEIGFGIHSGYAVAKSLALQIMMLVAMTVGRIFHGIIHRMIESALSAQKEALLALGDRNQELSELLGSVAHELKNPMASIQGLAQLLERNSTNSERRWEMLKQELARARAILDDFLVLGRPFGTLNRSEIEVAPIFTDLVALHEGLAAERGVNVTAQAHGSFSLDPRKVKQALINLVQNAIEASPRGGAVRLLAQQRDDGLLLAVDDDGPGLPATFLCEPPKLGFTTKVGGNGIGLAVARVVAEQHGGHLLLQNRAQGGARVALVLKKSA